MSKQANLSRRALMNSTLAAVAMTSLPVAAQPCDPALEAIKDCKYAWEAYGAALSERDDPEVIEDYDLLEDRAAEAMYAWLSAWRKVLTVTPTTIPGAAALAVFMSVHSMESGGVDTAQEALTALAASLQDFAAIA